MKFRRTKGRTYRRKYSSPARRAYYEAKKGARFRRRANAGKYTRAW